MCASHLLRPSSGVERYSIGELRRNTTNRGSQWDVRRGVTVRTILIVAVTADAMARQSCRLVRGCGTGLDAYMAQKRVLKFCRGKVSVASSPSFLPSQHPVLTVISQDESSLHRL